jgi:superfamily II DNA or RNA helicase
MKILDEAHHLTSNNCMLENHGVQYIKILKIPANRQLALTATIKHIEQMNENIISNTHIEYFGNIIEKKCLLWAIDNKIICDYVIQTLITDQYETNDLLSMFNITGENNQRLFLSAYIGLKSIYCGQSHHLLLYTNSRENCIYVIQYINMLLTLYIN